MKRRKSNAEISKIFGANIKAIRKNRGLSVKDAAAGLSMSSKRLSEIENGAEIRYTTLLRFLEFYKIKMDNELFTLFD